MRQNRFTNHAITVLGIIEYIGLAIITVATIIAGAHEVDIMVNAGTVTLGDLLLMFLYLEILAMVGLYFKSGRLPIRFPIYIAIVALARYLVLDMKNLDEYRILGVTAAILLLTVSVLVIRYGHTRYAYEDND
jgi:protein PsiE